MTIHHKKSIITKRKDKDITDEAATGVAFMGNALCENLDICSGRADFEITVMSYDTQKGVTIDLCKKDVAMFVSLFRLEKFFQTLRKTDNLPIREVEPV